MAVYFKIHTQYKRFHDGKVIEANGSNVGRAFLEYCLAVRKGPAPSRVLKDASSTFVSTEFPVDQNCCIRLCEAADTSAVFVRGILMVLHGGSVHLRTFDSLLADEKNSRRRVDDLSRQLLDIGSASASREAIVNACNRLWARLEDEQIRYAKLNQKLCNLNAGKLGISAVFKKFQPVQPISTNTASKLSSPQVEIDVDEYFAMVFLSSKHATTEPRKSYPYAPATTDRIIKLFESDLLSRHPEDDCWEKRGSDYFRKLLHNFLDRDVPIQFCLPAFPCKSTNPEKTSGTAPDGAEYEALHNLHQFCFNVQHIHPTGASIVIVSDGHVFSDCIGANDRDVDKYTDAVKEISGKIHAQFSTGESPITFITLHDVFHGLNPLLDSSFRMDWTDNDICRPIKTEIDPKDEHCRRLLLRSCGFDNGMLEKAIKDDENHSLTKVYRGFSRFMRDDLANHPDFKHQSSTKRAALANAVAKEMLKRNQAYSHLVELLYPFAIRLSIHQHKNHGPKFAVNVLHKHHFKPIRTMADIFSSEDAARYAKTEEAHIPTPWHNVIVEVEGHAVKYVCKNGIVEDEKKNPDSIYECTFQDRGRGARWYLKRRVSNGNGRRAQSGTCVL